jgi:hypothetical protein
MKHEIEVAVKALAIKAKSAISSDDALKFSQAALNLIHVNVNMQSMEKAIQ